MHLHFYCGGLVAILLMISTRKLGLKSLISYDSFLLLNPSNACIFPSRNRFYKEPWWIVYVSICFSFNIAHIFSHFLQCMICLSAFLYLKLLSSFEVISVYLVQDNVVTLNKYYIVLVPMQMYFWASLRHVYL